MSTRLDGSEDREFEERVAEALRRGDARREDELRRAAAEVTEADRRLVEAALAGRAPGAPPEERPPRVAAAGGASPWRAPLDRRTAALVATAAAAGLALLLWRPWREAPPVPDEGEQRPTILGADVVGGLEPSGVVEGEVARFRWTLADGLPRGGWCVIIVRDASEGAAQEPFRSPRLKAGTWEPSPEERANIPRDFRWEVVVYDAGGEEVGRAEASVRSSSSD